MNLCLPACSSGKLLPIEPPHRFVKCGPAGILQYFTFTATHSEIGSPPLGAKPISITHSPYPTGSHLLLGTCLFSVSVRSQLHYNSVEPFLTSQVSAERDGYRYDAVRNTEEPDEVTLNAARIDS